MKHVEMFIDGSCLGNPGPGGYGIILRFHKFEKQLSKGFICTTNNRMELIAAIIGLESLKESCKVIITTDSQYLRYGILKWLYKWKSHNWLKSNNKPVINIDLWKRLDKIIIYHQIQWYWVKSHSGHKENEICDDLAKKAANDPTDYDIGYLIR